MKRAAVYRYRMGCHLTAVHQILYIFNKHWKKLGKYIMLQQMALTYSAYFQQQNEARFELQKNQHINISRKKTTQQK
jgi:hypothetical protein